MFVPRKASARAQGPSHRFISLTDRLLAPVLLTVPSGRISYVNRAAAALLHQEREWLLGRSLADLAHPDDREPLLAVLRNVGSGQPSGRSGLIRFRGHPPLGWQVLDYTADNLLDEPEVGGILISIHDLGTAVPREQILARLELEADLRRAVAGGALALAFQPIVRLSDRSVVGSEALLRWHRPGGDVAPAQVVSVAEEAGLIVALGEWVAATAAGRVAALPGGHVSINLSPRQLAYPDLPRALDAIISARTSREHVQVEITETIAIATIDQAVGVLGYLRSLGFRVGLDDFGAGFSSLAYVHRFPIDFLKVDRSLIADVDTNRRARSVAGAAIKMAKALGLEVVVEGVERQSQAVPLLELGADLAQGHLFGAATELPSAELL